MTLNRRLYLGAFDKSELLFIPKREQRTWKTLALDFLPGLVTAMQATLWFWGLSLTLTYPLCIKTFRRIFPQVRSFVLIHLVQARQGIAPAMMTINANLFGMCKGVSYVYFDWRGEEQKTLLEQVTETN